jgi:hypothetical protein
MHSSYEIKLGHPADFKVRYRFYSSEQGGRTGLPHQGYRSDFWYPHPDHKENEIFMIWPEFEDSNGNLILNNDFSVPQNGIAQMWIIVPKRRSYHFDKIKPGIIGYFMEGSRKVAECEIVEIVGLLTNPTGNAD